MDHRQFIYNSYLTARTDDTRVTSLETLLAQQPFFRHIIQQHFPTNKEAHIVDLGCGSGAFVALLDSLEYKNVWGVDISPQQVEEAHRLGIEKVKEGDLNTTLDSLAEQSHDVIITMDVIEHFTKEELIVFAQKVHRVLKFGGQWVIHVPNGEGTFGSAIFFRDFTHQIAFTRKSITQYILACKFSKVSCFEDKIVTRGIKGLIRKVIWGSYRNWIRIIIAAETGDYKSKLILSRNFLAIAIK